MNLKTSFRKISTLVILFVLLNIKFVIAQNSTLQDLNNMFQNLNTSKLNTGILLNKIVNISHVYKYDGKKDTVCSFKNLKQIYYELYNGSYSNSGFKTIDSIDRYARGLYNNNQIPLLLINYDYNVLKAGAFNNGMVSLVNDKFEDNTAPTETPFDMRKAFAFSTNLKNTHLNVLNFYLDENLILTNSTQTISAIQVNFDDGLGLQNISINSNFPVTYSTAGDKIIKIKITYSDASILNASTLIHINNDLPTNHAPAASTNQFISVTPTSFSFHFTIQPVNFFTAGNSCATIQMGKDPSGVTHTCITNPIIFVEGVDFSYNHLGKHGDLGYIDFLNYNPDYPQIALAPYLFTDLNNAGYDIIYLDFYDGAADMEYNSLTLVSLINGINNMKCGTEENVVIGASMGGQVARYALAYMESQKMKTCSREYISFDSPHKGANIPLGLQYFLQFFAGAGSAEAQSTLDSKLGRPAAQQLLIYHYIGEENNIMRQQWLAKRDAVGYPSKMRKTCVINGSSIATNQGFPSGQQLIDYNYAVAYLLNLKGNVWAMPGYNSDPGVFKIFHGKTPFDPDDVREGPFGAATPHWDNAPGSPSDAIQEFDAPQFDDFDWGGFSDGTYLGYVHALVSKTTFIPSVSALDVNTTNLFYNIQANVIDLNNPMPGIHPFDAVYFQPANQEHVEITHPAGGQTNTNSEWLMTELPKNKNILSSTLSSTYNFGFIKKTLYSVAINSGGILAVNINANTDYGTNPVPAANSTYSIHTNQCGAIVEIMNGGNFILGQKTPNNKGIVTFESGSTLIIRSGGILTINDNSRLLIEAGAKIIFEAGAEIKLIGNNAVLEIKGDLELGANALFTFTYPSTEGSGYLKFSREGWWANNSHIVAGVGASIQLRGKNRNDKILEIAQDIFYISTFENISLFKIQHGTVEFTNATFQKYITTDAPTRFINCKFIGSAGAVAVWGQPVCQISNCKFEGVPVLGYLFMNGNKLTIYNTEMSGSTSALVTQGVGVDLINVNIHDNGSEAYLANLSTFNSTALNSKFNDNGSFGISLIGSSMEMFLSSSKVNNNYNYGLDILGPTLCRVKCGEIKNNLLTGIQLTANSALTMNTSSGGGYVDATDNGLTIFTDYAQYIDLNQGFNDLRPLLTTAPTIYTSAACTNFGNCPIIIEGTLQQPKGIPIMANNNKWQINNSLPLVHNAGGGHLSDKFTEVTSTIPSAYPFSDLNFEDGTQGNPKPCGFFDPGPCPTCPKDRLQLCADCNVINTPAFVYKKTNEAIVTAISQMDTTIVNGYKQSVNLFHQILKYPLVVESESDKYVKGIANRKMLVALAQAIENTQVLVSDSTLEPEVQKVLEIQTDKINDGVATYDYKKRLYGSIEKALVYRAAEHRIEALSILDDILTFVQTEDQEYVTYLKCVINNEQLVKTKQITRIDFITAMSSCVIPHRTIPRSMSLPLDENTGEEISLNSLNIYPNPTSKNFNIEYFIDDKSEGLLKITDVAGKLLYKKQLFGGKQKIAIEDCDLSNGMYMCSFYIDGKLQKQEKLVIIK